MPIPAIVCLTTGLGILDAWLYISILLRLYTTRMGKNLATKKGNAQKHQNQITASIKYYELFKNSIFQAKMRPMHYAASLSDDLKKSPSVDLLRNQQKHTVSQRDKVQ